MNEHTKELFRERLSLVWSEECATKWCLKFEYSSEEVLAYFVGYRDFLKIDCPSDEDLADIEPTLSLLDFTLFCFQLQAEEVSRYAAQVSMGEEKDFI